MTSITQKNIEHVRSQIAAKTKGVLPFYASANAAPLVVTDRDVFPYGRFYRGIANSSNPVIYEREAGWRRRNDSCYEPQRKFDLETPNYCWQTACSTVLPCNKLEVASVGTGCVIISP